jgi:protein-S-isoprenylcysteine O-methyltransferase Ste14
VQNPTHIGLSANIPRYAGTSLAMMFCLPILYITAAIVCLIQWGSANPWHRVDFFSVGYLSISTVFSLQDARLYRKAPRHRRWSRWTALLLLGEFGVFLDYGHLHLVPALEQLPLQVAGLALCLLSLCWFIWTDGYLARHFSLGLLVIDGPYQYVRHPRYLAWIGWKAGFALSAASILGWILVIGWILVSRQRIKNEENHLTDIFGTDYRDYANRTARLFPKLAKPKR